MSLPMWMRYIAFDDFYDRVSSQFDMLLAFEEEDFIEI